MVEIVRGISTTYHMEAAEIYFEAFEKKLTPVLGASWEKAINILKNGMCWDSAFFAIQNDRVVGLLGFHDNGKPLINITFGTMIQSFGIIRGTWRALIGALLSRQSKSGELLMDGIAVHTDARGQGVGTQLFDALFTFAREAGYNTIRLDVVNTNPRAQHLYERLGFKITKTESVPFLKFLGFTAVMTMVYDINK